MSNNTKNIITWFLFFFFTFLLCSCNKKKDDFNVSPTVTYRNSNQRNGVFKSQFNFEKHMPNLTWNFIFSDLKSSNSVKEGNKIPTALVYEDVLYQASPNGMIYAFDIESGKILFQLDTKTVITGTPVLVYPLIYFGSNNHVFYCYNLNTKMIVWKMDKIGLITTSPLYDNHFIYIGSQNNYFYALDATTGKEKWIYQSTGKILQECSLIDDFIYFFSNCNPSTYTLFCLNKNNGKKLWSFALPDYEEVQSSPILDSKYVVFSTIKSIYVLNHTNGLIIWKKAIQQGFAIDRIVVNNNKIYLVQKDSISIINISFGNTIKEFDLNIPCLFFSSLIISQNERFLIFSGQLIHEDIPYNPGVVCFFDLFTGNIIWKDELKSGRCGEWYISGGLYKDLIYFSTAEHSPIGLNCTLYIYK